MTISDTLTRITQIQSQIASMTGAFAPQAATTAAATGSSSSSATTGASSSPASSTSFAAQLSAATSVGTTAPTGASTASSASTASGASTASLSAAASSQLTSGQQQFAARLASDTGLDTNVVAAWMLAEESGGAAQSRQAANNNDWLNIGYTDSATYGATDSIWSDPKAAADATAGWLKGQNTIPGYGIASSGIQSILGTAGSDPSAQIAALQRSGWASSGYPSLPALYQQLAG